MTQTILVTGATGFVGRRLVPRLIADGYAVRSAVRRAEGSAAAVMGDIGPDTDWSRALEGIDSVVHLAGRAHVLKREADALAAFRLVNAAGTARLAEQAERAGVRRFVLISSVKAAADTSGAQGLVETDPPHPGTPYGISKLEGERALLSTARLMEAVVLRPPLVYGPGVKANFLALLRLVHSGIPLPLASVRNRRSLIALDDLVDAIVVALTATAVAGGIFYVADGPPLSTPELIRALAAALGRPARLFTFPPGLLATAASLLGRKEAADSLLGSLALDDKAFRTATGWRPQVAQQAAFAQTASWYRGARGVS